MATTAQQNQFINEIGPLIQAEAKKRGYHVCSPVIAQACCESAYGLSGLSKSPYFNYFGLKCGSSWKGRSVNMKTKEEYNSQLVTISDNFRCYDNMADGVKGYFDFVSTKRYANLKTATTPRQYLEYIKKDGYATSSAYVTTCMNYVNRHDLTKFDWNQSIPEVNPYSAPTKLLKKGDRGDDVKWLQYELNAAGFNLSIDGIFGIKTLAAYYDYMK